MNASLRISSADHSDLAAVLALQDSSLRSPQRPEGRRDHGFLQTKMSLEDFANFVEKGELQIAKCDEKIVGYAVGGDWSYFKQWPIFTALCERLAGMAFGARVLSTENTYQYGPICIAREHQGLGIFRPLLLSVLGKFSEDYIAAITFIDAENRRSLAAHRKEGLEVLDFFQLRERNYFILAFDNRRLRKKG